MCHTIRTRARTVIAKVSVCFLSTFIMFTGQYNDYVDFQVKEYQASFASYRYLWTDDRSDIAFCYKYI